MRWQTKWRSNEGDWKGTSARGSSTALLAFWGESFHLDGHEESLKEDSKAKSLASVPALGAASRRPSGE